MSWSEALRYEMAFRRQASRRIHQQFTRTATGAKQVAGKAGRWTAGKLGSTKAGGKVGDASRSYANALGNLPFLTLAPDAARITNCLDKHVAAVKSRPDDPLARIQLAAAMAAYAQDQAAVAAIRSLANHSMLVTRPVIRALTALGKPKPNPVDAQLVAAYRLLHQPDQPKNFLYWHCLARIYLLSGKPGAATKCAANAYKLAHAHRLRTSKPAPAGERLRQAKAKGFGRLFKEAVSATQEATNKARASYTGDAGLLDPHTRACMNEGAALVVLGWAYRDLAFRSPDEEGMTAYLDQAERAANLAIKLGYTYGYAVLAAILAEVPPAEDETKEATAEPNDDDAEPDEITEGFIKRFLRRLNARRKLLEQVRRRDDAHYTGFVRGVVGTTGAVLTEQGRKTGRTATTAYDATKTAYIAVKTRGSNG